jgi:hypothetical protein
VSADKALERVPEVIRQVMEHISNEPHGTGGSDSALNDSMSLRSMLIQLGAAGRALAYDHDALGLRAILYGMAEIAVGWAMDSNHTPNVPVFPGEINTAIYHEICKEAERAHAKHGARSLLGDGLSTLERFAALAEECGEAADLQAQEARLQELIQVASVCVSWIAWLDVQPQDEKCCRCGSAKIAYHNYQGKPFCSSCADGAVAAEPIVSAEIHASCGHCPDWHPAGTDRALLAAQELAREVTAIAKQQPGHYEITVYADPDTARGAGHYHVRCTWARIDKPASPPAEQVRAAFGYIQKKYGPDTVYAVIQYGALGTVNIQDIYADEIPALRAANESAWMIVRPYEVK